MDDYWKTNREVLSLDLKKKLDDIEPYKKLPREDFGKLWADAVMAASSEKKPWCYIILGWAQGKYVRELWQRTKGKATLLVAEHDLKMLKTSLCRYDYRDIIQSGQVLIITDDDKIKMRRILVRLQDQLNRSVYICDGWQVRQIDFYANVLNAIIEFADCQRTEMLTQITNSPTTYSNVIGNLMSYMNTPGISYWRGKMRKKPAVIICAGPSLNKHIDLLRIYQGKAVYICPTTMWKPLVCKDINPHFIAALDYHEKSGRFFEGMGEDIPWPMEFPRAVFEPKGHPDIRKHYPDTPYMLYNDFAHLLLAEHHPSNKVRLASGATVAHLCFYIAEYLECDPIILCGQDLGWTDGRFYADCVYDAHKWKVEADERIDPKKTPVRQVRAWDGKSTVSQDEQMHAYAMIFEDIFNRAKEKCKVIDATEGGANKKNTENIPLKDALAAHCKQPLDMDRLAVPEYDAPEVTMRHIMIPLVHRLRELETFRGCLKELQEVLAEAEKKVDNKDEIKRLFRKPQGIRRRANKVMRARQLCEVFSGPARLIVHQDDTEIARTGGDVFEQVPARINRDKKYVDTMLDAANQLTDKLKALLTS